MKTRIINYFAVACVIGVQLGTAGYGAAEDCCPDLSGNNGANLTIQAPWAVTGDYTAANNPAYLAISVNSGPLAVPPGNYLGWCIDANNDLSQFSTTYDTLLFSSCDPNLNSKLFQTYPASVYVSPATWHQINYILNHKNGAYFWNVQLAIWRLIGGPTPGIYLESPYPPRDDIQIDALLLDAANNAANWQLPCGGTVAVVAEIQNWVGAIQLVILEVPCVCPPTCTVTPDRTVCAGSSPSFTATGSGGKAPYSYSWTGPNGFSSADSTITINNAQVVNAGTYTVVVTDANNLTSTCQATLTVNPLPVVNVDSATICVGGSATLTAMASPRVTYLWSNGEVTQSITVSPATTTDYTVTVTGAGGCKASATGTVTVIPNPTVSVDSQTICVGGSATLTATASPGVTYLWSPGGETTPSITVSPAITTVYTVTVTGTGGCKDSASGTVIVVPSPTVSVDSKTICEGGSATLTATASPGVTYLWSPGGAMTASITVSPLTTTVYTVTVTGAGGCTASASGTVIVNASVCVPSTFNFNGSSSLDGENGNIRTFTVDGISVKVSAFSRNKADGSWSTAWLGQYGGGLGVTDSSEGDGSGNAHTVDNLGRVNYVLFEFSEPVVLNRANLGYVVTDSDLSLWVGNFANPFANHLTLSDAVLGSFGYTEENLTDSSSPRWADLNAGEVVGNAIIIAALESDTSPEDQFKIALLDICKRTCQPLAVSCVSATTGQVGVPYSSALVPSGGTGPYTFAIFGILPPGLVLNPDGTITGTPTIAGTFPITATVTDSSGATATSGANGCSITIAPPCAGSICGSVRRDCDANGYLSGEAGLEGFTVTLIKQQDGSTVEAFTDASGNYCFGNLAAGTYKVVVTPLPNYTVTAPSGCNDEQTVYLAACQNKTSVNFGYTGTAPKVSLEVTADRTSATCGQTITYTFTVKNTGNTCLYGGMRVDAPLFGGQVFHQTPVSPGEEFVFTKTYLVKSSDAPSLVMIATAIGDPPGGLANVTKQVSVTTPVSCTTPKPPPTCLTTYPESGCVKLSWTACSGATSYTIKRCSTRDGSYTVIKTGHTSTSYSDYNVVNGSCYYYKVCAVNNGVQGDDCEPESAIPCGTLPSPWKTKDVGTCADDGGANYANSKFTVMGSGNDIWNAADGFRYVYQSASGNCTIIAKVVSVGNTDPWAKAGVMIRENLTSGAKHASVFVTPANGVAFQYRTSSGGSSGNVNTTGLSDPYWVKIVRSGNTFTAYRSANGSSWTTMGSKTISMSSSVYIGLAVTSHNDGTLCPAVFQNVTATP